MVPKAKRGVEGGQGWGEVQNILGTEACGPPRACWTHSRADQHDPGEGGGTQPEEMRPRGTDTRPSGKALGQGVTPTYPGSGHRVSTSPEAAALPGFSSMSHVTSVFGCLRCHTCCGQLPLGGVLPAAGADHVRPDPRAGAPIPELLCYWLLSAHPLQRLPLAAGSRITWRCSGGYEQ